MYETARLAGFFAAHGVWCVSDGETLIPLLGYQDAEGERGMLRFVNGDTDDGAETGQEVLRTNPRGVPRAVFVADALLHFGTASIDALMVEAVHYDSGRSMKMAVPYRPQPSPEGFAVHRPKLIDVVGVPEGEYDALADAFFDGVDSHEKAAEVWNAHHDPSI